MKTIKHNNNTIVSINPYRIIIMLIQAKRQKKAIANLNFFLRPTPNFQRLNNQVARIKLIFFRFMSWYININLRVGYFVISTKSDF